jgi:hypothetical protein
MGTLIHIHVLYSLFFFFSHSLEVSSVLAKLVGLSLIFVGFYGLREIREEREEIAKKKAKKEKGEKTKEGKKIDSYYAVFLTGLLQGKTLI